MKTKYKQTMRQIMIDWTNEYMYSSRRLKKLNSMLQETVLEKWKPTLGKTYCYINDYGQLGSRTFSNDNFSGWDLKIGNCFPYTKEGKKQAEEYRDKLINLNK